MQLSRSRPYRSQSPSFAGYILVIDAMGRTNSKTSERVSPSTGPTNGPLKGCPPFAGKDVELKDERVDGLSRPL